MEYPSDFNNFWSTFKAPKTASKLDALKAWKQTEKYRPEQAILLACCQAYNNWLAEQAAKSGREYPKLHPATFLRQARYEGFEDDAQAILKVTDGHSQADLSASAKSWEGSPTERLLATNGILSLDMMAKWAHPATFIPSIPPEIRSPSVWHRDELEKRFGGIIRKTFGQDVQLTVAKKMAP